MKKLSIIFVMMIGCLIFSQDSQAKWWIFGQGTDGITTEYIYLNQNSFDEAGESMTLFKESLKDGTIRINGKASVRNAKIGAVSVTVDNKATWQKAKLSKNGSFEYIFTPETGKEYQVFIKIMDTLGKTNDIDSTYKIVKVTNENIYQKISEALNGLAQSYQNEEPQMFMNYVSNDFAGDYTILDYAVRKDFNAFDYIQLRTFINNISRSGSGKVYVAVQYIRKVVSSRSGRVYSDNGYTEFVFKNENGNFKIFSMKNPLLFGLSDAGELAAGTIQNINNNPIVLVDSSGNVDAKPFRQAIEIIENDSAIGGLETETVIIQNGNNNFAGYQFVYSNMTPSELHSPSGSYTKRLAVSSDIDSITTTSVTSGDQDGIWLSEVTRCYAIRLSDGKYMLVQFVSGAGVGSTVKYKFQPDGSNTFN